MFKIYPYFSWSPHCGTQSESHRTFFLRFSSFIFREGREGERGKHPCARETLIGCLPHVPNQGPATRACVLTRNQTNNHLLCRIMPNQLCHTGQGFAFFFLFLKIYLFLESGREGEGEREKHGSVGCLLHDPDWDLALQLKACVLTRN